MQLLIDLDKQSSCYYNAIANITLQSGEIDNQKEVQIEAKVA